MEFVLNMSATVWPSLVVCWMLAESSMWSQCFLFLLQSRLRSSNGCTRNHLHNSVHSLQYRLRSLSLLRFPVGLRWASYAASKPPKGESKTQNGQFLYKSRLLSKTVCYKVSLCENCQRQDCKAFTGLSNRAQIVGGGLPLKWKILCIKWTNRCYAKTYPPCSAVSVR